VANAVSEIIALGKKLEAAQELAERAGSLEQAIGESEARLAASRQDEDTARLQADRARAALNELHDGAKVQAEAIRRAADAEAARTLETCKSQCAQLLATANKKVEDATNRQEALLESVSLLEAAETKLAQSVTTLRAELESLKARING